MSEHERSFVRRATGEPFIARDGATIFELLRPETSSVQNMSIASGNLKPGQKALSHFHKISEEAYYVVSGVGQVTVDHSTEEIKAGDEEHIPVNAVHALNNTSMVEDLEILAISSPPYSDDDIYFID